MATENNELKVETSLEGVYFEEWYQDGKLHREHGPAVRKLYSDGFIIEEWYYHGVLCNWNEPGSVCRIDTYPDGTILEWWSRYTYKITNEDNLFEFWFRSDAHNPINLGLLFTYHGVSVTEKLHNINATLHRPDGPAIYVQKEEYICEEYYLDGELQDHFPK